MCRCPFPLPSPWDPFRFDIGFIGTDSNSVPQDAEKAVIHISTHLKASPSPGYSTDLMEPCGALPRKCLFIYLFICSFKSLQAQLFNRDRGRVHP
jgi:hypothetical protein